MIERQTVSRNGFRKQTERVLNKIFGYEAEPRVVVRPFVMMKSIQDQDILIRLTAKSLWNELKRTRTDPRIIGEVVYDMFYALNDVASSKYLLEKSRAEWNTEQARMAMASATLLRIHTDNASIEEQRPFYEFCEDNGLEIASITLEEMQSYFDRHPDPLMSFLANNKIGNY